MEKMKDDRPLLDFAADNLTTSGSAQTPKQEGETRLMKAETADTGDVKTRTAIRHKTLDFIKT